MILDTQNVFSSEQAVTSTAISTNVIDLNPNGTSNILKNIGVGEPIYLIVRTVVAATDSGSDATLTITLESDSTANLATSATVHYTSGALPFATFSPAGSTLVAIRLPEQVAYERYLGVRYTVASGPLTAGTFDAFLAKGIDAQQYLASGFAV